MGPAIKHVDAIIGEKGDSICDPRTLCYYQDNGGLWGVDSIGCVRSSAVEHMVADGCVGSNLCCCEFADALLIFAHKVLMEFNECLLSQQVHTPHISCGEDAGGLKLDECLVLDGIVSMGIAASY